MIHGIVWLILICLSLAGPVSAEQREGSVTVSPMAGRIIFEGEQKIGNDLAYSLGLGYNLTRSFALEGVFTGSPAEKDQGGSADLSSFRLDTLYHYRSDKRVVPYLGFGIGSYKIDGEGSEVLTNYGGGVLYHFHPLMALRGEIRHLMVTSPRSTLDHNLLYTVGVKFQFGGGSPPPPERVVKTYRGTPKPVAVEKHVPAPRPAPKEIVPAAPVEDAAAIAEKARIAAGLRDDDHDGVFNKDDQCPNTQKERVVDSVGCEIKLTVHIRFDVDSDKIKPDFSKDMEKIAEFIRLQPPTSRILLLGHTDDSGSDAYNQKLSERRAEAVKNYLLKNFHVDPDRFRSKGYGENQPIADNATPEGRALNRRIEVVNVYDAE